MILFLASLFFLFFKIKPNHEMMTSTLIMRSTSFVGRKCSWDSFCFYPQLDSHEQLCKFYTVLLKLRLRICLFSVDPLQRGVALCCRLSLAVPPDECSYWLCSDIWLSGLSQCVLFSFPGSFVSLPGEFVYLCCDYSRHFFFICLHYMCFISAVWQKPPALGSLQRPHWGCAYPAEGWLWPGHPRWCELIQLSCQLHQASLVIHSQSPWMVTTGCISFSFQVVLCWNKLLYCKLLCDRDNCSPMASSSLEWDPLDCTLVGLLSECKSVFPTDGENTDLWLCQVHSLWSLSSATDCSASSRTCGSRRCRLKQQEEEEEERRDWRRSGKEPGGSERVKEVSLTDSYWASGNLTPFTPRSFLPWTNSTLPSLMLRLA